MLPDLIIKDFNVFKARGFQVGMGSAGDSIAYFEAIKLTFDRGVVPAVAFAAHETDHTKFLKFAQKGMAGVLIQFPDQNRIYSA